MRSISVEELACLYFLSEVKGFGPQKFKRVYQENIPFDAIADDPMVLPVPGKTGEKLRAGILESKSFLMPECVARAEKQLSYCEKAGAEIITYDHSLYPKLVFESNYPVPVLYARGNIELLQSKLNVACVGSRLIREPYIHAHESFSSLGINKGFLIVSGFATGADAVGHTTALMRNGYTIGVMPSGLQRPFPPENSKLWEDLLSSGRGLFVSESAFGVRASRLTLQKRNKLIVAFSRGVMLSQTSAKGGAMNAYRFALEQKKPIATYLWDETDDTSGNKQIMKNEKGDCTMLNVPFDEQQADKWLMKLSYSI